ncbi:dihydrofolate reductase family protein [Klenkia taihuensis]|uniref:Dihydrofolate reductase n=1 Tax=Klenkia taihuensis TaxID=1225127 RepID=A0A1I1SN85_9ACTN|nr:dihydrofolate reductase family protein [Klenkia taihuensis]GHE13447.1 deaminase reductase [Klenkia taihuensis]SFD45343.1 Dihydrofolate reductase [Klenkia taihuensis]
MRRLRYAINTTLDGCCHHEAGLPPDDESMAFWTGRVAGAGALLYGRVTYSMMESAWRRPADGDWPAWMGERETRFAEAIDAAPKVVLSRTLAAADWHAELVRDDPVETVRRLKEQPGDDLLLGGVRLPVALVDAGLVDELELLVHPLVAGHGPTLLAGLQRRVPLELVDRQGFGSGVVAQRFRVGP